MVNLIASVVDENSASMVFKSSGDTIFYHKREFCSLYQKVLPCLYVGYLGWFAFPYSLA